MSVGYVFKPKKGEESFYSLNLRIGEEFKKEGGDTVLIFAGYYFFEPKIPTPLAYRKGGLTLFQFRLDSTYTRLEATER